MDVAIAVDEAVFVENALAAALDDELAVTLGFDDTRGELDAEADALVEKVGDADDEVERLEVKVAMPFAVRDMVEDVVKVDRRVAEALEDDVRCVDAEMLPLTKEVADEVKVTRGEREDEEDVDMEGVMEGEGVLEGDAETVDEAEGVKVGMEETVGVVLRESVRVGHADSPRLRLEVRDGPSEGEVESDAMDALTTAVELNELVGDTEGDLDTEDEALKERRAVAETVREDESDAQPLAEAEVVAEEPAEELFEAKPLEESLDCALLERMLDRELFKVTLVDGDLLTHVDVDGETVCEGERLDEGVLLGVREPDTELVDDFEGCVEPDMLLLVDAEPEAVKETRVVRDADMEPLGEVVALGEGDAEDVDTADAETEAECVDVGEIVLDAQNVCVRVCVLVEMAERVCVDVMHTEGVRE